MNRPTSVTVFAILNLVFAGFGLLTILGSLALFAATGTNSSNPVIQLIQDSPTYALWMKISIALSVLVAFALLAAGIGLLLLKPWARVLSIAYAIFAIVMNVAGTVVNFFYLVLPLLQKAHDQHGPAAAAAAGGAIGGTVGSCFGLIYPILLLIFMLRPKVIAAFSPASSQSTDSPTAAN